MTAARTLYDAHVDAVYRVAGRIVGDPELARDCTQEAFIRAFRGLRGFRGQASLRTWLHAIAASVAIDEARRTKKLRARELELDEADAVATGGGEPDPELRTRLAQAIDALPEIQRVVFVMYDVEGFTHAEIGSALGIPEGTSKARLSYARAQLREALADCVRE